MIVASNKFYENSSAYIKWMLDSKTGRTINNKYELFKK